MVNWDQIKTVMLDMDGTLLDLHYDNHFWLTHLPLRFAEIHGLSLPESKQQLHRHIRSLEGTLNWYCLDYWSKQLNIDIVALKSETKHKIRERPNTQEFLKGLKASGKVIYLVTNAHPDGVAIKFKQTCIEPFFDKVITSHQFQAPKEQQSFWRALARDYPFNNDSTLFIDDNKAVLDAAQTFGIKHILGIHQPDSQQQRMLTEVSSIHDFDEIMAGLNNTYKDKRK
ncbi:MAG: putative hydrolase of the HAD superfamily [Glaciecola sp.]|jgi:putative hydrolase of the HAD superfamily